ncbi:hypothetical protein AB9K89_25645 (plasmid) [Escherichia coli]|uniref:hypothetical protein n=1 Tax=Escherichia coli TaxID=562 RepID=UPI00352406DB
MGQLNVFRRQLCEPLFNIRKLSCGIAFSYRNSFCLRQSELVKNLQNLASSTL